MVAVQTVSFLNSGLGAELHDCGQTRTQTRTHLKMRVIEVSEIVETDRRFKCL